MIRAHGFGTSVLLAGLLLPALLAGCASQGAPKMGTVTPDDRFVLSEIHRSAGSIDRHIRALERASLRNIRVRSLPPPTGAAAVRMTLDYDGPMEEAVRAVARMIRYRVAVAGRAPVVPEIVSVHMRRKTVQAVLEDIGLQTGSRVGLSLDASRRRIAIRYGNARANDGISETGGDP
ncbi:MAG: DotD/TraH family lipoprotein [Nitrospiraceae bacterium]|nr:DotD/TraH family lipoprotein [Nitrospiraceae bacterium]